MPKLQSLDLNALQDQGRPKDSVLAPCSPHGIPIHTLRNYNDLVTKDHVQTGPMCRILPALYGHSTTLPYENRALWPTLIDITLS